MGPEMDAQCPAPARGQHIEVAAGLRRLDDAKTVFMARYVEVDGIIAGDLQKHPGVGSALISLPGRMEKARSKAETCGDPLAVADRNADRLQRVAVQRIALHIGKKRAIIPGRESFEVGADAIDERAVGRKSLSVGVIGKQGEAAFLKESRSRPAACRSPRKRS